MTVDAQPLFLTLRLALVTTLLLFILGIPLAYWLAYTKSRFKNLVETLVSMPLVLPPTVLGFYLLLIFSPGRFVGQFLEVWLGIRLVFHFSGIVLGSVIFSLPFMVQPIQAGFSNVPRSVIEASWSLGKGPLETLFRVIIPASRNSVLTALVLTFAHSIGEFGVVLMMGGNIAGETRVASIAIYNEVEALNYANANIYSMILFFTTFVILLMVFSWHRRGRRGFQGGAFD